MTLKCVALCLTFMQLFSCHGLLLNEIKYKGAIKGNKERWYIQSHEETPKAVKHNDMWITEMTKGFHKSQALSYASYNHFVWGKVNQDDNLATSTAFSLGTRSRPKRSIDQLPEMENQTEIIHFATASTNNSTLQFQ